MTSRNAALVVPIVLTNAVAVSGQLLWGWEHLTAGLPQELAVAVVITFALAIESIGIFLAVEAHQARMAGDASGFLLAGAYAVGLLAGALNYSHWIDRSDSAAVAFGVMSALSPWLWSIRSRSMHRADLRAKGLIDPRAVRFSTARKLLYPVRTLRAYRAAVWVGEVDPAKAVGLLGAPSAIPEDSSAAGPVPAPGEDEPAPAPPSPPPGEAPERVGEVSVAKPARQLRSVRAARQPVAPVDEERRLAELPGWVGETPPADWRRHVSGAPRTQDRRLNGARQLRAAGAGRGVANGEDVGAPTGASDRDEESERVG
jgi:hypothetical protein